MDVIRHQRVGVERDIVGLRQLAEAREQQPEVVRRREAELAVVAPADDVDGAARGVEPGEARHGDAARGAAEIPRERVPRRTSSRPPSLDRT